MNKQDAKEYIHEHPEQFLERDGSGKGFICPICGSGSGQHGTGITAKAGDYHFTCWAGDCFKNSDIIDIIGVKYGLTGRDKFQKAYDLFGLNVDDPGDQKAAGPKKQRPAASEPLIEATITLPEPDENAERYADEIKAAAADSQKAINYLELRGISPETAKAAGIGWTAKGGGAGSVLFPYRSNAYNMRRLKGDSPKYINYGKLKLYCPQIMRDHYKQTGGPVFVVEGEIDALSILEAGGTAIATGSTNKIQNFLESVPDVQKGLNMDPSSPFIIFMDNDGPGQKAQKKILENKPDGALFIDGAAVLKEFSANDPNEALTKGKPQFSAKIQEITANPKTIYQEQLSIKSYLRQLSGTLGVESSEYIPTGFKDLDEILNGGITSRLYVLGAVSGFGKTTFCLQVMEQMARSGRDVLFYSLEMGKDELIARMLSRITLERCKDIKDAKTETGISIAKRWKYYSDAEKTLISEAVQELYSFADHIQIIEGNASTNAQDIRDKMDEVKQMTGTAPVLFVDFIQIMGAMDENRMFTDKQVLDSNILPLKLISREFDTPVLVISSFNRENYNNPVNKSAFKESGSLEYTADVLIGLQAFGMDYQTDLNETEGSKNYKKRIWNLRKSNSAKARKGQPVQIQLKILKNRNGAEGSVIFEYLHRFNNFKELGLLDEYSGIIGGQFKAIIESFESDKDGDLDEI
jgi:replicative DNA helicase